MNTYHPQTVFSSIDRDRRYAYGNQPLIAQWNLACLANALLPLIHTDPNEAIRIAKELFQPFMSQYEQKWTAMMVKKLGFRHTTDQDALQSLIIDLLNWMQENKADYTNTFLVLQSDLHTPDSIYTLPSFLEWRERWESMLSEQGIPAEEAIQTMRRNNPAFIPRNHLVEQALDQACYAKDYTLFHQLLEVVQAPYQALPAFEGFQAPPEGGDGYYQTFCGT